MYIPFTCIHACVCFELLQQYYIESTQGCPTTRSFSPSKTPTQHRYRKCAMDLHLHTFPPPFYCMMVVGFVCVFVCLLIVTYMLQSTHQRKCVRSSYIIEACGGHAASGYGIVEERRSGKGEELLNRPPTLPQPPRTFRTRLLSLSHIYIHASSIFSPQANERTRARALHVCSSEVSIKFATRRHRHLYGRTCI